jgi:hypothetical protein
MSTRKPFFAIGCGIAIALVILVTLFGVTAYQFRKYQATVESLSGKTTPILIAITDPFAGQTVPAGTPLLVHVNANAPDKLLSLELWANGQIVGIQGAPTPDGINPFEADFAWTPADSGTYTLIARGVQAGNQSGDSAAVVVIVGPTEKITDGSEAANDGGQTIPISNGGGGDGGSIPLPLPPAPPNETDSSAPAEMLSPSLTNWLFDPSDDPPQAPQLTAEPSGCGATLSIHDLSQNEDGFIVFRMTEASPMLTKITTLKGQSEVDWLTYNDESDGPTNSYMVRAFNGSKVADSNIVFVEGNPADCEKNASEAPVLSIQLTSLKSDLGADMAYCYKSLNGVDWSRWPVSGFFMPGADGFDIQSQADSILLNELEGKTLTLDLECWGWVGGSLTLLGKLHQDNIGPGLGNLQLANAGLLADLNIGGVITTKGGEGPPKPPTGELMPNVFAIIFFGQDACTEHLPSGGSNFLENLLFCTWFPEYNVDQGASQPYLVWYVNDPKYQECLNGEGAACNSFQFYVDRVKLYGGQLGFNVYSQASDSIPIATMPYDLTAFVIPPQITCGKDPLLLTVRMFWVPGPNDPIVPHILRESIDSNTVSANSLCPPPQEIKLDVTFDTLRIGDLGDGIGGGDDLEIYASFVAEGKDPGTGSLLNMGRWGWSGSDCINDVFSFTLNSTGLSDECPRPVKEGDLSLGDQPMCASNTYSHCVGSYSQNNNKIQITVGDGSRIRISVHAMDYDTDSADDDVCHVETWVGPESIFGWQGFTTSGQMSQGDNGSASCKVFFHIAPSP